MTRCLVGATHNVARARPDTVQLKVDRATLSPLPPGSASRLLAGQCCCRFTLTSVRAGFIPAPGGGKRRPYATLLSSAPPSIDWAAPSKSRRPRLRSYRYPPRTGSRRQLPVNRALVKLLAVLVSVLLSPSSTAQAQESPQLKAALPSPDTAAKALSLVEAVELALSNYPSVRASMARERARGAEITLAKTAYLPRGYSLINENRASMNRVAAVIYPAHDIPVVADRVGEQTSFRSFWTANAGAGLDWEIYDFGLRAARVKLARAETSQAAAALALTRLEVATAAADSFLAVTAAQLKVRAEQANVDRMEVFRQAVHALVDADLRPGVDASRADAELALAKNELIEAQQALEVAAATLAERLGVAGTRVTIEAGPLADMPPTAGAPPLPELEDHPLAVLRSASLKTVQAKEHVLSRTYFPHLHFESSIYGRSSGTDQRRWAANQGFLPVIPNWAVGLTVSFPFMSIFEIKARERIAAREEQEHRALYAQAMQTLKGDDARSRAVIDGAVKVAANAPAFVKAARETETRARVRYEVGLGTVVDVAEAERLLVKAEVIYALSGLGVWRAFLAAAVAHGDLRPFLQLVTTASGQRK